MYHKIHLKQCNSAIFSIFRVVEPSSVYNVKRFLLPLPPSPIHPLTVISHPLLPQQLPFQCSFLIYLYYFRMVCWPCFCLWGMVYSLVISFSLSLSLSPCIYREILYCIVIYIWLSIWLIHIGIHSSQQKRKQWYRPLILVY